MRSRRTLRAIVATALAVTSLGVGTHSITASAAPLTDSAWYHMYDVSSTKCLDNWSTKTAGAQVRQYNCYNGTPQMWRTIYSQGDITTQGWFVIENEFSGDCLWVSGDHTTTNGEAVVQEPCNYNFTALASTGENWYFEYDERNADYFLSSVCVGQSACGGSYGAPTSYFLNETTKTNGAIATIQYNSAQDFQGPY